jgi:type II secretory pathway pseudopilin PulG
MTEMPTKPTAEPSRIYRRRNHRQGEDGYILLAVLFMVAMVLVLLAVAAPKVAADIERDREIELQHRGKQYVRAIKLYYKKFGAYPPNMDALVKTSEIRFLRKRYKDPVTGKDEWHLIHFGENKTPTAYGFFGQPMGGTSLAGIGPGGVGQNAGGSIFGNNGTNGGSAYGNSGSAFGSNSGSAFGSSGSAFGSSSGTGIGGGLSNSSNSGFSNSGSGTASGSSDPTAGNTSSGNTGGSTGTSTDPNAAAGSGSSSSGTTGNPGGSIFASSSGTGNGQTFGGGGIIGVESTSPKATILEYKKKKHFNEWEFVYDPMQDQMMLSNNTGAVGQPMSGAGNSSSGIATPGGFGNQAPVNGSIPPQQPQQQQPPQQQQQTPQQ